MGSDKDKYKPDRPLFVGNFDYTCPPRDLERLIDRYGAIDHIDMKMGFAFVYLRDTRDGDDAIKDLDGREWGDRKPRRLKVEWAKGDGEVKRREDQRRVKQAPTSTLFIVNFDVANTREADLAYTFEKFGPTKRVQIKKNFAFIQFEKVEDAEAALLKMHHSDMHGRTLTVEYVANEAGTLRDGGGGGGGGYRRSRSRTPPRRRTRSRTPPRRRSRSRTPPRRRSPSPDYGRGSPRRNRSREPRASPVHSARGSPARSAQRSPSRSLSPR